MRSISSYTIVRNSTYYLRVSVPKCVHHITSKREVVKSLKTDSLLESRAKVARKYHLIRKLKCMSANTSQNELQALFDELTDFTEIDSHGRYGYEVHNGEEVFQDKALANTVGQEEYVSDMLESGQRLGDEDYAFTQARPDYTNKSRQVLFERLYLNLLRARTQRMIIGGDGGQFKGYIEEAERIITESKKTARAREEAYTLKQAWVDCIAYNKWEVDGRSVRKGYSTGMEFVLFKWGEDIPVKDITREMVRDILDEYAQTPVRSKGKGFYGKSWAEIYEIIDKGGKPENTISSATVNEMWLALMALLDGYLRIEKGIYSRSLTEGNEVKKKQKEERVNFSNVEMRKIGDAVSEIEGKSEGKKWAILVAMYSGMRMSEVITVLKDGIKIDEDTGIKYFYVTDGKTGNATREIPVHKYLLELGLVEALDKGIHHYGDSAIKQCFSSVMVDKGIPRLNQKRQARSFHSLRHSFNTQIGHIPEKALMQEIMGRERGLGTSDRYIHEAEGVLQQKQDIVNSVNY